MAVSIPQSVTPEVNPYRAQQADSEAIIAAPVVRIEHQESLLTRMIEHQTAKIPSNYFLVASLCAMGVSLGAELTGSTRASRFIGMWAGPLLTMGLYNKMVKMFGPR
jgi:hypothetical protein